MAHLIVLLIAVLNFLISNQYIFFDPFAIQVLHTTKTYRHIGKIFTRLWYRIDCKTGFWKKSNQQVDMHHASSCIMQLLLIHQCWITRSFVCYLAALTPALGTTLLTRCYQCNLFHLKYDCYQKTHKEVGSESLFKSPIVNLNCEPSNHNIKP